MDTKPGWQTSEFWLALAAMVVGSLLAAGVFPAAGAVAQVLGFVASVLATLGYTYSRAVVKSTDAKVEATKAMAAANPPSPPLKS